MTEFLIMLKKQNREILKRVCRGIEIKSQYSQVLKIDFIDYPELKPVAEKMLDYIIKSEESKQNEIKIEIAKVL